MKKYITLFLLAATFPLCSLRAGTLSEEGGESYAVRDSVLKELDSLPMDREKCRQELYAFLEYMDSPWSPTVLDMAIRDARALNDTVFLSYGLYYSVVGSTEPCDSPSICSMLSELRTLFGNKMAGTNYFRAMAFLNDRYIEDMNYEAAFSQLDQMEKEATESGFQTGLQIAWIQRADIYMGTGRYDEAIEILEIIADEETGSYVEKLTAYMAVQKVYFFQKKYDKALAKLHEISAYLERISSQYPDPHANDVNFLAVESNYISLFCALEEVDSLKTHITRMERYYTDSETGLYYLQYHKALAVYHYLTGEFDDSEMELDKCLGYKGIGIPVTEMHFLQRLKSAVHFGKGLKDSACAVYTSYIDTVQAFYEKSMDEQREKVMADFYSKKGYAGQEQYHNWLLKMLLAILTAGVLVFAVLFFWNSHLVSKDRKVSMELNRSYKAAEQANREREEILVKIRESISNPLHKVLDNAGMMDSGNLPDKETKMRLQAEINENAGILNSIISDFLNEARAAAGKARI